MPTTTSDLTAALQPALDACMTEKDRHEATSDGSLASCSCGWSLRKASPHGAKSSAGLHVRRAHKAADKAYDAAAALVVAKFVGRR